MTDAFQLHFGSGHDNNGNGQPRCERTSDAITGWVSTVLSELVHKLWIDEPISDQCFDSHEERMARLLAFLKDDDGRENFDDVRDHLVECARCRFIYARLRTAPANVSVGCSTRMGVALNREVESVPTVLREYLRSTGPVVFPGGKVADGAWEFGRLGEISKAVADEITETVGERAWRQLKSIIPRREIVLVCFSQPMHRCGKRVAAKMVEAGIEDVHVVMADDFFSPKLWCDPRELQGRHVLVFVDVVHSGGLLERLYTVCRDAAPRELRGLAVIDQTTDYVPSAPLSGLWAEAPEVRVSFDALSNAKARFFDPTTALARKPEGLPKEVADPSNARATVEKDLVAIEPIFQYIEATGALKQDARIGGVNYPWAIDLLCLLRHDEARAELARRATERLADLASCGKWCLVFPTERHKRAGAWAELLADALGWPIVSVGLKSNAHFRPLTGPQRRQLARHPRTLIVDSAIRSGKTLQSLVSILRRGVNIPERRIVAFYAFDGLFAEPRAKLQEGLDVEVRSLFQLPLGAPTEPVGRHCRHRLQETLAQLDAINEEGAWSHVVRAYCKRKLERLGVPPQPLQSGRLKRNLRQALEEGHRGVEARLEHACDPPRPSLVKHLDVTYALREPRTRNVLHGFLCNSMPPEFIESCALALATQEDYEWLDRDWLLLHKRLFTNRASLRWQFLACIGYWMRREGDSSQVRRARQAVEDFRRSHADEQLEFPFPSVSSSIEVPETLDKRCDTLLSVLTPT